MPLLPPVPPLPEINPNKSLTPQRKHRKLLKDGSGAEVWPESIEKIFVQGLREYWSSPYATYPQSRGRSRWRNQFLVDYLQKHNITRTKKQVASHIQVLRNMWKGEPEYQLVAGGEELLDSQFPTGSNVKLEESWSTGLIPLEFEDTDGYSSTSASPDFSPPDFQNQFLPSPDQASTRQLDMNPGSYTSAASSGLVASSTSSYVTPYTTSTSTPSYGFSGPFDKYGSMSPPVRTLPMNSSAPASGYPKSQSSSNRVHNLRLTTDGMSPFTIRMDALIPPHVPYEPLQLKIRLGITTIDNLHCPPSLHGFMASVSLSHVWPSSAKCVTKVVANGTTISEEVGSLEVSDISVGDVNAVLPESYLSRCRWLDANTPTNITQEIFVDDVSILFVIYELDRSNGNPMPSAQLMGFLKYPNTRAGRAVTTTTTAAAAAAGTASGTSTTVRHYSVSPPNNSADMSSSGSLNRIYASPTSGAALQSSSSCGMNAMNPAYNFLTGAYSQHTSSATSPTNDITNGANGSNTSYSFGQHYYSRHSSQSLAHTFSPPVRYALTTSLPS